MGAWNAKARNQHEHPVAGGFGLGERNEHGEKSVNCCFSFEFVIANTLFQQPKRRTYTWRSLGIFILLRSIYIIIFSQKFRNCVQQTKTADIGSDHNPAVMKLLVKLKQLNSERDPQLDMSMLRNEDLKKRYNLSSQNRYEILAIEDGFQPTEERQIENQWKMLKDSTVNAAKEVLPCKKKETKQSWMPKDILEKMRERKEAIAPLLFTCLSGDLHYHSVHVSSPVLWLEGFNFFTFCVPPLSLGSSAIPFPFLSWICCTLLDPLTLPKNPKQWYVQSLEQ